MPDLRQEPDGEDRCQCDEALAQAEPRIDGVDRQDGEDTVLQIRAFLAGTGDLRRVRELISQIFTERKQPLPVVTIVQSGGLPMTGAQVVLEAVGASHKDRHSGGLAWISAQLASVEDAQAPMSPLAEKSIAALHRAVEGAGAEPAGGRPGAAGDDPHPAARLRQSSRPAGLAGGAEPRPRPAPLSLNKPLQLHSSSRT